MGTFGSRTTPTMAPQLRRVAAAARELLLQTAAKEWNTVPAKLVAAKCQNHRFRFGAFRELRQNIARGKTLAQQIPDGRHR